MVSDPIADLLTRIRNANQVRHDRVVLPHSKMKEAIVSVLKQRGFIRGYQTKGGELVVLLRYEDNQPAIRGLQMVSKQSRRVYRTVDKLPYVKNGFGMAVIRKYKKK